MEDLNLKCRSYPDDSFINIEDDVYESLSVSIMDNGQVGMLNLSKESALEMAAWINEKYKGEIK